MANSEEVMTFCASMSTDKDQYPEYLVSISKTEVNLLELTNST